MDKSHEVGSWEVPWSPSWRTPIAANHESLRRYSTLTSMALAPPELLRELEHDLGASVRTHEGDRISWWAHDPVTDELRVRIPQEPFQPPGEGLWVERRFALTNGGPPIRPTGHAVLHDYAGHDPLHSRVQSALGMADINRQCNREVRVVADLLELGDSWQRAAVEVRRPGRKGMSDLELAQWARKIAEAYAEDPERPYQVLADRYPGWSDSGYRSIARRARRRKPEPFLTEVRQGQTLVELTAEAKRVLGIDQEDDD